MDMRLHKFIASIFILFSACAPIGGLSRHPPSYSSGSVGTDTPPLVITIIDVGQGDATLIEAPNGETMLVDVGPAGAFDNSSIQVEGLKYVILTHYHEDHIGGIVGLLADTQPTGGIYDRGDENAPLENLGFETYADAAGPDRHTVYPGQFFDLGGLDVEVVAANGVLADRTSIDTGDPPDENAASIALLIEYSGFKMLVAADITGGGGEPPYTTPDIETSLGRLVGDIDILRVAHHGSKTSTNAAFLRETTPEVAVISLGDDNDYGHPHDGVIERLKDAGIDIYQTERGWLDMGQNVTIGGNIMIEVDENGGYEVY